MSVLEVEKHGVRLDLTINLGQIITVIMMITAVISAYWALNAQMVIMESKIGTNQVTIAKQQDRLDDAVNFLQSIKTDIAVIRYRLDDNATKDKIQGR